MSRARLVTDTERLPASSRYRLLARLASGGMATVYVGQQRSAAGFKRLVAIKRAHAHLLEDPQFRASFVAEARLASLLRHRNIVSVTDVEDTGRDLIIVMDYVDGGALSDLLESGDESGPPLPIPIALKIIADACAGLAAAHQARSEDGTLLGLVHRDVSPHNILIGCDGSVYLTDFGIAKACSTSQTATGVLKGKFAYMAPEYILGKQATQESDVFSMGVVLWEALTGRRLFAERSEMATLGKVAGPVPAPLVSTFIDADEGLDTLVARAVAKDPEARYASMAELHDALQHYARKAMRSATASDVADVVRQLLDDALSERRALLQAALERPAVYSASDEKVVDEHTKTRAPQVKPHTEMTSDTAMSIRTDAKVPAPPSRLLRYAALATVLVAAGGAAAWLLREQLWITQGGGRSQTLDPPTLAASPEAKNADGSPAPPSRPTAAPEPVGSSLPERSRSAERPRPLPSPPKQPQPTATDPAASGSAPVPTWAQCNPYKHPPDPNCQVSH